MLETGQSIYTHTHRRANDTLSRFTFFTWLSRQSWKSSLPLTERQVSAEHSHGRLWHRNVIKYLHSAGTHPCVYLFYLFIYFFSWRSIKAEECSYVHGHSHLHVYYLFHLNSGGLQ